ncbi:hypothetical protein [Diaphorobacter sp. LR2014-1]|nr:hypothetical protein [Diaphorobacter sp. LR2014-1]
MDDYEDFDDDAERCEERGSEDIEDSPEELSGVFLYRCCSCGHVAM